MRWVRVAARGAVVVCGLPLPRALAAGHRHPPSHPIGHSSRGFFHSPHGSREFFHAPRGFFPHRPSVVLLAPVPFVPFGFSAYTPAPVIYQAPPPVYAAPAPVYQPTPTYYPPTPTYYPPSSFQPSPQLGVSPPPAPSVVEFPTGRYELRGDGMTTPYVWVWIPNPPTAPSPPSSPSDPASSPSGGASSPSHDAYRWIDDEGVTTWTDRLDKVPARYRARARVQR